MLAFFVGTKAPVVCAETPADCAAMPVVVDAAVPTVVGATAAAWEPEATPSVTPGAPVAAAIHGLGATLSVSPSMPLGIVGLVVVLACGPLAKALTLAETWVMDVCK